MTPRPHPPSSGCCSPPVTGPRSSPVCSTSVPRSGVSSPCYPSSCACSPTNRASAGVDLTANEGAKRASRHVGGLVPKRARGRGLGGAPHALNDRDPCPWSATPLGADVTGYPRHLTHHPRAPEPREPSRSRGPPEALIGAPERLANAPFRAVAALTGPPVVPGRADQQKALDNLQPWDVWTPAPGLLRLWRRRGEIPAPPHDPYKNHPGAEAPPEAP